MLHDFEYLKNVLSLIRATSRPVESDDESKKKINEVNLNNQWKEVEDIILKMIVAEKELPETGSNKIAEKVKQIIDRDFPGAQLNTDAIANNHPRIVMFIQGGKDYRMIEIDFDNK